VSLIIEPFNYSFETLICILLINSFFDTSFEPILIGLNFKLNQDFYASICENKDWTGMLWLLSS